MICKKSASGHNLKKLPIGQTALSANTNAWRDASGGLLTTDATIRTTFDPSGGTDFANVVITDFYTQEDPLDCGPASQVAGRRTGLDPEEDATRPSAQAEQAALPERTVLRGAVPNPGRGILTIAFDVAGSGGRVRLDVYDVTGRKVGSLVEGQLPPGRHQVAWSRTSPTGGQVAPGVYFLRMEAPGFEATRKMVVLP